MRPKTSTVCVWCVCVVCVCVVCVCVCGVCVCVCYTAKKKLKPFEPLYSRHISFLGRTLFRRVKTVHYSQENAKNCKKSEDKTKIMTYTIKDFAVKQKVEESH